MSVVYSERVDDVEPQHLDGFFVGWPSPPSPERHLELLRGSSAVVLAREAAGGRVVGFVTAISDGVLSAYIPLLEVLPDWQGRGIGTVLMRRMLDRLGDLYMVDLSCDAALEPFYRRLGLQVLERGMGIRNLDAQAGRAPAQPPGPRGAGAEAAGAGDAPTPGFPRGGWGLGTGGG